MAPLFLHVKVIFPLVTLEPVRRYHPELAGTCRFRPRYILSGSDTTFLKWCARHDSNLQTLASLRTFGADAMPTYCTRGVLSEANVTATLVDWLVGSVICVRKPVVPPGDNWGFSAVKIQRSS